jgi:hypothetical protein
VKYAAYQQNLTFTCQINLFKTIKSDLNLRGHSLNCVELGEMLPGIGKVTEFI